MCNYTPTFHVFCGCTTFELPSPNPCPIAISNCTPCIHKFTTSSPARWKSRNVDNSGDTSASTRLSSLSPRFSPSSPELFSKLSLPLRTNRHVRTAKIKSKTYHGASQEKTDGKAFEPVHQKDGLMKVVRSFAACPFCLEDEEERDFAGKEKWGLGKKILKRKREEEKLNDWIGSYNGVGGFDGSLAEGVSIEKKRRKLQEFLQDRYPRGTPLLFPLN